MRYLIFSVGLFASIIFGFCGLALVIFGLISFTSGFQQSFFISIGSIGIGLIVLGLIFFSMRKLAKYTRNGVSLENKEQLSKFYFEPILNPFDSADKLIKKTFPDEKIISKKWCLSWSLSVKSSVFTPIPIGTGIPLGFPILEKLIESERAYYIDERLASILKILFVAIILFIFYQFSYFFNAQLVSLNIPGFTKESNLSLIIQRTPKIFLLLLPGFLIATYIWTRANIRIINKSWIEKTKSKGRFLTLVGVIPENKISMLSNDPSFESTGITIPFRETFFFF